MFYKTWTAGLKFNHWKQVLSYLIFYLVFTQRIQNVQVKFPHRNFSILLLFSFILTHRQVPITDHFGWKMRMPWNNAAFIQKNSNTQYMKPPLPTVAPCSCASNVHVHVHDSVSPQNLYRAFSSRPLQIILARAMKAQRSANKRTRLFDITRNRCGILM